MSRTTVLFSLLLLLRLPQYHPLATVPSDADDSQRFPDGFLFGAATSAYQIEGGWDADGKSPSIWDDLMHQRPDLFAGNETSDIAADSYHRYEQDVEALLETGFDFYRFSISWTRVMPNAVNPNEAGLQYYDSLIDRLLAAGIQPMVTMYHFDLPSSLQTFGGWTNAEIRPYFVEYARLLFERYGRRVRWWTTMNEPFQFCVNGYARGRVPPMQMAGAEGGEYLCIDNVLKSHALVYRMYREKYYDPQVDGRLGIVLNTDFYYDVEQPTSSTLTASSPLVDRAVQFFLGVLAAPIFSPTTDGYYPDLVVRTVAKNSRREGRKWSRLPQWTRHWRNLVRGSADFLGLNYYSSKVVWPTEVTSANTSQPSLDTDRGLKFTVRPEWPHCGWQYSVPRALGDLLRWIRDEYNNPDVFITENGWMDMGGQQDYERVAFFRDHLKAVLNAVVNDGCKVRGYAAWSLIDNFEWLSGNTVRFGMYSVDPQSDQRQRRPKLSADYMRRVIQSRIVPDQ